VACFSSRGTTFDEIWRAAEEDDPQKLNGVGSASSTGPRLEARFFGHFELSYEGRHIVLDRNVKALAILKYLLAHRNKSVSRDHLMAWLWPESNAKRAKGSLNTAMHAVRKALKGCPLPQGCSEHILLESDHYILCPALQVWTDVEEFERCNEEGCSLELAGQFSEGVQWYERAVALYRGQYLQEDLYEDWTMVERQRLNNAYVNVLHRLTHRYVETGHYRKSIEVAYLMLAEDPHCEFGNRLLMESYARLGLHTRALKHYDQYAQTLRHKLASEPSQETKFLRNKILGEFGEEAPPFSADSPN
jgi:DNA-binding SARP family transcriptional activator